MSTGTAKALEALQLLNIFLETAARFTGKAKEISDLLEKAGVEGRELTEAEWGTILSDDNAARLELEEAVTGVGAE